MLREELRQRLVKEYRYAVTKMQQESQLAKKLFYFSVLFGEAQRTLNWEWDTDIILIYTITQHAYTQLNATMQTPALLTTLPVDWTTVFDNLTKVASDLANYLENAKNTSNKDELFQILGRFSEISYAISGNGSYLYGKGVFTF